MKLFIDSTDTTQIKQALDWGLIDGITTNPTLASKSGKHFPDLITELFQLFPQDAIINLEVISTQYEEMLLQARKLASLDQRVVVKIPCTIDGLKAVKTLAQEGIRTNVTLVFSLTQALLSAKMGAYFVSPFVGRLDDISENGLELIKEIVTVYKNYNYTSQILFASVRSVEHVRQAALFGVDIVTAPFAVLSELYTHPLTDKGLAQFLDDWNNSHETFI